MWDSVISQSKVEPLLPTGILWVLKQFNFDGTTMKMQFVNNIQNKAINVSFDPVYYSVSHDWVEDYGGMNGARGQQKQASFGSVDDIKKNIGKAFPEQKHEYDNLKVYCISAMQWIMRFACFGTPSIVEIHIE